MSKMIKVRTVGAVIDRHPIGSEIELNEKTAERLSEQGFVEIIGEVKAKPKAKPKTTSKPKKESAKAAETTSKD